MPSSHSSAPETIPSPQVDVQIEMSLGLVELIGAILQVKPGSITQLVHPSLGTLLKSSHSSMPLIVPSPHIEKQTEWTVTPLAHRNPPSNKH